MATKRKPAATTKAHKGKGRKVGPSKHDIFVAEYLKDFNGARAASRAGYALTNARYTARDLLQKPEIQEKVTRGMVERAARTKRDGDEVLDRLWRMANADPREICEVQIGCCRYCYGKGNRYQRTPREMEEYRKEHDLKVAEAAKKKGMPVEQYIAEFDAEFDNEGGIGWNPTRDPLKSCPECFGEGARRTVFKDTRDLSPDAALLFGGVKETQHGLQVLIHDQPSVIRDLGKHHGLFRDRLELTGKDGAPLKAGVVVVPAKVPANDAVGQARAIEVEEDDEAPPAPTKKFQIRGKR